MGDKDQKATALRIQAFLIFTCLAYRQYELRDDPDSVALLWIYALDIRMLTATLEFFL